MPGFAPEPCPEGAFGHGPLLESVPEVARIIMEEKGKLVVVFVEHPRRDDWVYIFTRSNGGAWRKCAEHGAAALIKACTS